MVAQTSTISIIRLKYIGLSADITYDNMTSSCWSCIEVLSGVTCASLPTLRPLAGRCFPGLRSITSRVGRLAGSKGSGLRNSRKKGGGSRTGTLNTLETNRSHVELLELRALEAERKRRHLVRTVDMAVESDGEGSDGILGLDDARRAEADSGREYRGPARHAPMSHRRGSSAPKPREMAPAPVHHVHAPTSRSETTLARPIEALLKADSSPTGVQTEIAGGRGRQQSEFRGTGIAVERKITVTRAKSVL